MTDELVRLDANADAAEIVVAVTHLFMALEDTLDELATRRLRAVVALYDRLGSYSRVADATELSKSRVAQLHRQAQDRGL